MLRGITYFNIILITIFTIFRGNSTIDTITQISAGSSQVESMQSQFFTVKIYLILRLVVATTDIYLRYSFYIQQPSFQLSSYAIGSCHIITINFKVGTGLSRHTCITTSKNHLCLTKLRILLQIITHLIADLLQRDFTISRIHQTDIERNNVRTVILHRSPCIIRISLAYSIVTYLHYFLILCHPLIGQLLRYLLSQLFTGTNRQFKLYSNTGIILCREKFCTNTFGTE